MVYKKILAIVSTAFIAVQAVEAASYPKLPKFITAENAHFVIEYNQAIVGLGRLLQLMTIQKLINSQADEDLIKFVTKLNTGDQYAPHTKLTKTRFPNDERCLIPSKLAWALYIVGEYYNPRIVVALLNSGYNPFSTKTLVKFVGEEKAQQVHAKLEATLGKK